MRQAALPFPLGIKLRVFRDDGNWDNYSAWFMRTHKQIEDLFVAGITLGHYEGSEEPAYDHHEWCDKADRLLRDYPGCVFVYASNDRGKA